MAQTSELIEFRRAFVWLLCGMLLPSVALVAFGVVAVANERAAVEQRLSEDYSARLQTLERDLSSRLDRAADAAASGDNDPLLFSITERIPEDAAEAQRRAEALPLGGHILLGFDAQGERRAGALLHTPARVLLLQFDLGRVIGEVPSLAAARS
jgi:hypothetical protein